MIASETYYRTDDGRLCEEGDPRAAFLICRKGTEVDVDIEALIAECKMVEGPAENKAIEQPADDKRMRVYKPRRR